MALRPFVLVPLVLMLAACGPPTTERAATAGRQAARQPLPADLPAMRRFPRQAAPPATRSNAEIAQDFLDLAFEMESGRALPTLTRFDGPVGIALTGAVPATAAQDLDDLIWRLQQEAKLPVHHAASPSQAAIVVEFLPKAQLQQLVPNAACYVVPGVSGLSDYARNSHSARTDWSRLARRLSATIFVPSDASPQEVRDCLHEETAQALGPLNDLYRLPDSVFNDDNFHAVLTGFDMLILRAHYAPELANGMTRAEVAARLPALLARLNPAGERAAPALPGPTPRAWVEAIETALAPQTPPGRQLRAAERALHLAQRQGWQDTRMGFSLFVLGRSLTRSDPQAAAQAFQAARATYARGGGHAVQLAHVDMQLAAFALTQRDGETAARLAHGALPAARAAQNAGLLASLLQIQAAAQDLRGHATAAQALRAESLGWARYGIGDDLQMLSLMADIASLAATRPEG